MTFRPLGVGLLLAALSLTAGCCCWRPFHGCHRCCYASAAPEAAPGAAASALGESGPTR
jgi:hypothetical protein